MTSDLPPGARLVAVIDGGQAFVLSGRLHLQAPGCRADLCLDLECLAQFEALLDAAGDALATEQERAARMVQPKIPAGAKCATCGQPLDAAKGADKRGRRWYCLACLLKS